jgi:glycosyltransferase involved in cell wall biosynthesis
VINPPNYIRGVEGWGESDVEEVVAALENIYNNRDRAQSKGQAAAAFMQNLTWQKQVNSLTEVIRTNI